MANTIISTAETLSVNFSPGQDTRTPSTSSQSIFSFGDFRLERASASEPMDNGASTTSFSNFSTLSSLSAVTFKTQEIGNTSENELNPNTQDPQSYSYFGSFYTKVASSINSVIANFPYAMLATSGNNSNTIFNYSNNLLDDTSTFSIPISAITNQGSVIFASGNTIDNVNTSLNTLTLFNQPEQFGIQLSGNTANTHTYDIIDYSYSTGSTGALNFTLDGLLFTGNTTSYAVPVYIRPSPQRYGYYQRTISHLENQLLFDGKFMLPDPDDESLFITSTFTWPKTIDGFNPDGSGDDFDTYSESILASAQRVDETKTNWLIRTMIPENYLELDTDTQIYQKLISVYSEEFDRIKQYIDNLAFAHTVTYDAQENIPDKFIHRLSNLLGFKFNDAFTDSDVFEYLSSEDDDGKTFSDYNLELWRKILVNINWLYKRKGTRDAIQFIFKLVGAPECLINFNEFVYNVNRSASTDNPKVNVQGFPNYNSSDLVFQEGGAGRGNGQAYINQWSPEFEPTRIVDNVKVYTGDTDFGTQSIMNSKEVEINLDSASAIECDVKSWFNLGYGTWLWGSTGMTVSPYSVLPFSGLTVPFEWLIDNVSGVTPSSITAMTISQWMDFVYASNVDPRNRKTYGKGRGNMVPYHDLKRVYMTYMYWTNNQLSNRLTFEKLGKFLDLIERNFFSNIEQLIPATSIYDAATVYRNTIFNRQKFVYPEGINLGSEFQSDIPPQPTAEIMPVVLTPTINDIIHPELKAFVISAVANDIIHPEIPSFEITASADTGIHPEVSAFSVTMDVDAQVDLTVLPEKKFVGNPIVFPEPVTLVVV